MARIHKYLDGDTVLLTNGMIMKVFATYIMGGDFFYDLDYVAKTDKVICCIEDSMLKVPEWMIEGIYEKD